MAGDDVVSDKTPKGNGEKKAPGFQLGRGHALSPRILMAKQFFLHGDETGKRVLDPNQLAEKVGCHVNTIHRYTAIWIQEHEKMLIERNGNEWSLALSAETLKKYKADVEFAERQTAELAKEIESVESIEALLKTVLLDAKVGRKLEDKTLEVIDRFMATVMGKKALRAEWRAMEKFWIEISGMESRISVSETYEKETVKAKARAEARGGGGGTGSNDGKGGGFFDV